MEMDLTVLFFLCDIVCVLGMLKWPETIIVWRHWFGSSFCPGTPLNSPRKLTLSAFSWTLTLTKSTDSGKKMVVDPGRILIDWLPFPEEESLPLNRSP
jgi:hypothetical protein